MAETDALEAGAEPRAVNPQALMTVGEVLRLASQSPAHRDYTIAEFEERFLMPASVDQFRVYRTEIEPVAVVTWALVSDDIHKELETGRRAISADEWRSGDNLWIIEAVILPEVAEMVFEDLTQSVFPNKIGNMWVADDDGNWAIERYYGANRQGDAFAAEK